MTGDERRKKEAAVVSETGAESGAFGGGPGRS